MKIFDAVVVGGGVAGAALALHLANHGYTIVLLEKKTGPDHKVCGEFISSEALPFLMELGLDPDQFGATRIGRARIYSRRRVLDIPLPSLCRGLSRKLLDHELLMRCRASGVDVRLGAWVQTIREVTNTRGGKPAAACEVRTHSDTYYGQSLFLATGKWDVRNYRNYQRRVGYDNSLLGMKVHLTLSPDRVDALRNHVDLFGLSAGYAGLTLVEGDAANLCVLLDKERLQHLSEDWEGMCGFLQNENPHLGQYLATAVPVMNRPIYVGNIPYGFIREPVATECYWLGDQFAVIPSFTGEGIFLALLSAKKAADCFRRWGHNGTGTYNVELHRSLKGILRKAKWVHALMKNATALEFMLPLFQRTPGLVQSILHQTRVGTLRYPSPER